MTKAIFLFSIVFSSVFSLADNVQEITDRDSENVSSFLRAVDSKGPELCTLKLKLKENLQFRPKQIGVAIFDDTHSLKNPEKRNNNCVAIFRQSALESSESALAAIKNYPAGTEFVFNNQSTTGLDTKILAHLLNQIDWNWTNASLSLSKDDGTLEQGDLRIHCHRPNAVFEIRVEEIKKLLSPLGDVILNCPVR